MYIHYKNVQEFVFFLFLMTSMKFLDISRFSMWLWTISIRDVYLIYYFTKLKYLCILCF